MTARRRGSDVARQKQEQNDRGALRVPEKKPPKKCRRCGNWMDSKATECGCCSCPM